MISIKLNDTIGGSTFYPLVSKFPNGEKKYVFPEIPRTGIVGVQLMYEDDSELFDLLCTFDTIRRNNPYVSLTLDLPYIPYSRMDRVEREPATINCKVLKWNSKTLKLICSWLIDMVMNIQSLR